MHLDPIDAAEPPELLDEEAAPPPQAPTGPALKDAIAGLGERLGAAQELLAASGKRALLVVLQGRDTAGKDGTIRNVFPKVKVEGHADAVLAALDG